MLRCLFIVGAIRELFGFGQLFGYQVIPLSWYATAEHPDGYDNFALMVSPPAAFFILGGMIWFTTSSIRGPNPCGWPTTNLSTSLV